MTKEQLVNNMLNNMAYLSGCIEIMKQEHESTRYVSQGSLETVERFITTVSQDLVGIRHDIQEALK